MAACSVTLLTSTLSRFFQIATSIASKRAHRGSCVTAEATSLAGRVPKGNTSVTRAMLWCRCRWQVDPARRWRRHANRSCWIAIDVNRDVGWRDGVIIQSNAATAVIRRVVIGIRRIVDRVGIFDDGRAAIILTSRIHEVIRLTTAEYGKNE